jgi:hypothetical protein
VARLRRLGACLLYETSKATKKLGKPCTGHSRDLEIYSARSRLGLRKTTVCSRANDYPWPVQQLRAIAAKFVEQDTDLLRRIAPFVLAEVTKNEQHPGALHMPEELVPEPATFGSSFNQSRDIGDHELHGVGILAALAAHADDAEMRLKGREGVVGDLGLGGRDGGDKS